MTKSLVYVADRLTESATDVRIALTGVLAQRRAFIHGARDIWCRDFMPVQVAPDAFVQFRYAPRYLRGLPHLRTTDAFRLVPGLPCVRSSIVLDGGNVVACDDVAIVTDRIFPENPRVPRKRLIERLRRLLRVNQLIIIPCEPGDLFGHADGVVQFVDRRTVLLSDNRRLAPRYHRRVADILKQHGFDILLMPNACSGTGGVDGVPPAIGCYINFLRLRGLVACPTYGLRQDDRAIRVLREVFPRDRVVGIDCRSIARLGGSLHCVTWDVQTCDAGLAATSPHRGR